MSKPKNKVNFKKYLGEGLLIVFSVLFALFINKTYEDAKTDKDKINAIEQIKAELFENQKILNNWMADHNAILENLNILLERKMDSIQILANNKGYLPMQMILNDRNLLDKPLSNSAWSSAQSTGIISEFDFIILLNFSETYELQQLIMNTSIEKIAERLFLKSNDIEHIKDLLIELRLRFMNLRGQEYRLEHLYTETIELLNR